MRSLSAPASGEALPMEQEFKQGYRMHRVLSNLNRLDVDRLDDADRERVETAIDILPALKGEDSRPALGYCGLRRGLFLRCERTSFLVKQERRWLCQPAVTPIL